MIAIYSKLNITFNESLSQEAKNVVANMIAELEMDDIHPDKLNVNETDEPNIVEFIISKGKDNVRKSLNYCKSRNIIYVNEEELTHEL